MKNTVTWKFLIYVQAMNSAEWKTFERKGHALTLAFAFEYPSSHCIAPSVYEGASWNDLVQTDVDIRAYLSNVPFQENISIP